MYLSMTEYAIFVLIVLKINIACSKYGIERDISFEKFPIRLFNFEVLSHMETFIYLLKNSSKNHSLYITKCLEERSFCKCNILNKLNIRQVLGI